MYADCPLRKIMCEHVITVGPDESLNAALQCFAAHPLHHLPVVERRRVVGMLSSADVMKFEFFLPPSAARGALHKSQWRVRNIMKFPAIVATEHDTVQHAVELLTSSGVHALPIVNGSDELVGIVTTTDLMQYCLNPQPEEPGPQADAVGSFSLSAARVATALASAQRSVRDNRDPFAVGATLLAMHQRMRALEQVSNAAKRYINAGQDEHLHAALCKALNYAERLDETLVHSALPASGMDI